MVKQYQNAVLDHWKCVEMQCLTTGLVVENAVPDHWKGLDVRSALAYIARQLKQEVKMTDIGKLVGSGWTVGSSVPAKYKGRVVTLYRCTRQCVDCGEEMSMRVSKAALDGKAKNRGLRLARCADCRNGRRQPDAEPTTVPAPATPQDALAYLIQRNEALTIENAELKAAAKFATHTPQPAAVPVSVAGASDADRVELKRLRRLARIVSYYACPGNAVAPDETILEGAWRHQKLSSRLADADIDAYQKAEDALDAEWPAELAGWRDRLLADEPWDRDVTDE